MPQLITFRRRCAGIQVTETIAAPTPSEPDQPCLPVTLDRIARDRSRDTISSLLTGSATTPAGR